MLQGFVKLPENVMHNPVHRQTDRDEYINERINSDFDCSHSKYTVSTIHHCITLQYNCEVHV